MTEEAHRALFDDFVQVRDPDGKVLVHAATVVEIGPSLKTEDPRLRCETAMSVLTVCISQGDSPTSSRRKVQLESRDSERLETMSDQRCRFPSVTTKRPSPRRVSEGDRRE